MSSLASFIAVLVVLGVSLMVVGVPAGVIVLWCTVRRHHHLNRIDGGLDAAVVAEIGTAVLMRAPEVWRG
jgi:hypothetical protein